ncbi:MAG: hypothetical protein Q8R44_05120 [Novosphingobium sp.]|nr:hypothetical protein [Novosphingobium sp.]
MAAVPAADGWVIGPIIKGRNYSPGMPFNPSETREGLFQIELPQAPGSVHYVTFRHGSLEGKRRIVLRYRLETARGTRVVATTAPSTPGIITPYFQRTGDNWSGRGRFESYRWYATFATQTLTPGEHQIVVPIDGNWTAVETSSAASNPQGFREAVRDTGEVGFVLGGGDGYGHGVHATGRARLIVTDFRVE